MRSYARSPVAGVVALTGLAAAARFIGLGQQSFWLDESASVHLLQQHFWQMEASIPAHDGTPPLFLTIAWPWTHLFGLSEVGLRSLSAVFGTLTVPVAWAVGRRFSDRVGLAVAALAACNPLLIWFSQEARCYALLVLLTSVALLGWLHLREAPTARWAAVWGVASALAFATHWYSVLIIAPEVVWLVRRRWHCPPVRGALYGLLLAGLCLLPWMLVELRTVSVGNSWMSEIPLSWRLELVPRSFAIGPDATGAIWLLAATGLAAAIAAWIGLRRLSATARRDLRPVAALLLGGLVAVAVVLPVGGDQIGYRYLLPLWLPVALLVAGGLAGPGAGRLGAIVLAGLCAVGLFAAASVLLDARYQRPDWKGVAAAVGTARTPPLYLVEGCSAAPLDLYLSGLADAPPGGVSTTRLDLLSADGQSSMAAVSVDHWAETCRPVAHDYAAPRRFGPFVRTGPPVRIGNLRVWRMRAAHPVRLTDALLERVGPPGALMTRQASAGGA